MVKFVRKNKVCNRPAGRPIMRAMEMMEFVVQ